MSTTRKYSEVVDRLLERVIDHSGLTSLRERRVELEDALGRRMEGVGCQCEHRYLSDWFLSDQSAQVEMDFFVEAMTIGETYFFRHPEVIDALRDLLTEEVSSGRRTSLAVWSAACSIGCEPYTLGIVLKEMQARLPQLNYKIYASDINHDSLARARGADFVKWSMRNMDTEQLQRYFVREDSHYNLKEIYQENIEFFYHNLISGMPTAQMPRGELLDVIFCRNILIYFDADTIRRLAEMYYQLLKPGGYLVLGPSEMNVLHFSKFESVNAQGAVLYRKPVAGDLAVPVLKSAWHRVRDRVAARVLSGARSKHSTGAPVLPAAGRGAALEKLMKAQSYALALEHVLEQMRLDELNAQWHLWAGFLSEKIGELDGVESYYKKAIYLQRKSIGAHYLYACFLLRSGDSTRAKKAFSVALQLSHSSGELEVDLPEGPMALLELVERINRKVATIV